FAGSVADTGGAGVDTVQVFNGATSLGLATVTGGTWSLDTTLASAAYHTLNVTVSHLARNASTTSNAQTIIVDTTNPTESFPTVTLTTATASSSSLSLHDALPIYFAGSVADTGGAGVDTVQVFNGATSLGLATVTGGTWSL